MKAGACDDTEDTWWQAHIMCNGSHLQAGQAAQLRGLQDAAVACSQGWSHLPLHTPHWFKSSYVRSLFWTEFSEVRLARRQNLTIFDRVWITLLQNVEPALMFLPDIHHAGFLLL